MNRRQMALLTVNWAWPSNAHHQVAFSEHEESEAVLSLSELTLTSDFCHFIFIPKLD
jgi:hypothetical protein